MSDTSRADQNLALAAEFATPTREAWLAAVDKALKGGAFERLVSTTLDGIRIEPLYTADDVATRHDEAGFPGLDPLMRGGRPEPRPMGDWDIRAAVGHPDPATANAWALTELRNGATSLDLVVDAGGSCCGVSCRSADDLRRVLDGVLLDIAPISLHAGAHAAVVAEWFGDIASERGVTASVSGCLGIDPIGTLAETGLVPQGVDEAIAEGVAFAKANADASPALRAFRANGAVAFDAGASEGQELAFLLGSATAYLRAMIDGGMEPARAAAQISLEVAADVDVFATIAKIRALRHCWSTVLTASGVDVDAAPVVQVSAVAGGRWLTEVDPWVNLLRGTAATIAAVTGGADIVRVSPFDSAEGLPGELGRRLARNTQLLMQDESHIGTVIDPGGGSYYIESLTDAFAEVGWAQFQQLETEGGIVAALCSGALAARITATASDRDALIAKRKWPITGVSEFPLLGETRPTPVDWPAVDHRPAVPLTGTATTATPLELRRLSEPYERLRAAAEAASPQPSVFLANIGTGAQYTARATFAANLFATAGVRALGETGYSSAAEAAAAFVDSGAPIAIICGSDASYDDVAVAFAQALKAAGAKRVYLAGRPGERKADYEAAGIDEFVSVGVDVLDAMTRLHAQLGVSA